MQPGTPASAVRGEDRLVRMVQDLGREIQELKSAMAHDHTGDQITTPVAEADGSEYAFNNVVSGGTTYAVWVGNNAGFHFGRATSSIRYKYNVREHNTNPADLLALTPVVYDRLPVEITLADGTKTWSSTVENEYGLIAEQVYEKFPELVTWFEGKVDGIRYDLLTVALLDVVKDQELRLQALEDMAVKAQGKNAQTGGEYKSPIKRTPRPHVDYSAMMKEPPLPFTINPADWTPPVEEEDVVEEPPAEEPTAPELETPPADTPPQEPGPVE